MTLDEAIKHAEKVAEENEKSLRGWKECINRGTVGWSDFDKEKVDTSITRCSKCAEEHRQLAEWLKDYKRLLKQEPKIGYWIEHPEIETSAPEYLVFYECSECGDKQCFCKSDIHKKRFCSNCGCRMIEPQESEE